MSRACCCSVSHADVISPITTIQDGDDAMSMAKGNNHPDFVSIIEQVVSECDCERWCVCDCVCVCVIVCGV